MPRCFVVGLPMNYIGIDISKYKHNCFLTADLGEVINEGFSFTNSAEGFVMLNHETVYHALQ